jgi:PAS domain S-box-containing protein
MGGNDDDALSAWLRSGGRDALDFALTDAIDNVGVVDPQLVIRYVNWAAPGLTREGVVGMSVLDFAPPDYRETAREHYLRVLRTGVGSRFEIWFQGEQQMLVFEVRIGPIRVGGEVIGLIAISTDVTEQRRAQADRDRFFSLSLDMLIVASPAGHLKRINPAFGKTLGYDVSELIDRPFMDYVHVDDRSATKRVFASILAGTPVNDFENRYRHRSGQYRVFSWRATVDPISKDVYAVARDITDKRETEAQLRHAQKMEAVGQLAGGIAHDFNNLMQAVLANTDLGIRMATKSPEILQCLLGIQEAGERTAALTKGLLAFSRSQALVVEAIDLNELVRTFLKILARVLPENIATELVTDGQPAIVSVDRTQMEQVIVNLAINARDAMERGGRLTLKITNVVLDERFCELHGWAKPGPWVRLTATDTGVGMTAQVRERIFEPFFTTKGPQHGTGLGLATAYGIVQQHGGMIDVHSQPGEGTTFTIHLPRHVRATAQSEKLPSVRAPRAELRGHETILLAEDEAPVREVVVQILESAGYVVLVASNGSEVVRRLREHQGRVHLAILDVVMPELDGPETWEQLRVLQPDLRVLFVSGYADTRQRQRLPEGAELLAKPFTVDDLLAQLRRALDA